MQSPLPLSNPPKHRHGGTVSLAATAVLLGLSLFLWLNHQYALDTVHFWTYQPSSAVASIVSRAGLSDAGTFALYAAQPSIDNSDKFNAECERIEKNTAILGCYVNDRIYLYDVTDQRLDGIKDVTAAHEMLHAVYQRMSADEKSQIDSLVDEEYKKLSADPEFTERMAFYARTEPGARNNELHSIIGTEVTDISPQLETHYRKYFTNRSKVVALHDGYRSVFTKLDDQANTLDIQLKQLYQKIQTDKAKHESDSAALDADKADLKQRAESGQISSQAQITQYNSEVQAVNRRVDALNQLRLSIKNEIEQYNLLSDQFNAIQTQTRNLNKSIDSTLAPAAKV